MLCIDHLVYHLRNSDQILVLVRATHHLDGDRLSLPQVWVIYIAKALAVANNSALEQLTDFPIVPIERIIARPVVEVLLVFDGVNHKIFHRDYN